MKIVNEKRNVVEKEVKKVGTPNPAKAELYEKLGEMLAEMFDGDITLVKKGSAKKPDDEGKMRTVKTGCEGLLFEYDGDTVCLEVTFKDAEKFDIKDCIVEATYTTE